MSIFRVKYLSFFFLLISFFSFLNILYSYYFNLYLNLNTYYFSLGLSAIIGLVFYKFKSNEKKPNIFEKILINDLVNKIIYRIDINLSSI